MFVKAKTILMSRLPQSQEGKVVALLQALTWAKYINVSGIIFELDSKLLVDNTISNTCGSYEFHVIIDKCRALLDVIPNSMVSFLRRQTN